MASKKRTLKKAAKKTVREVKGQARQVFKTATTAKRTLKALRESVRRTVVLEKPSAAPKKQTFKKFMTQNPIVKVRIPADKKIERDKIYKIRNFPYAVGGNYAQWAASIEEHSDEIDQQLKPNERFIGRVFRNRTKITYSSISELLRKMNEYVEKSNEKDTDKLISGLGIIALKVDPREYANERKEIVRKRVEKQAKIDEKAKKLFRPRSSEGGRVSRSDIIEKALEHAESMQKLLAKRDAQIDRMEKMLQKLLKPAKKAAKKSTPKKGVKKSASKKSTTKKTTTKKVGRTNSKAGAKPATSKKTAGVAKSKGKTSGKKTSKKAVKKSARKSSKRKR